MALKTVGPVDVGPSLEQSEDRGMSHHLSDMVAGGMGAPSEREGHGPLEPPSGSRLAFQRGAGGVPPNLNDLRAIMNYEGPEIPPVDFLFFWILFPISMPGPLKEAESQH